MSMDYQIGGKEGYLSIGCVPSSKYQVYEILPLAGGWNRLHVASRAKLIV